MVNFSFNLMNMEIVHFDLINFLKIVRSWPQNKYPLTLLVFYLSEMGHYVLKRVHGH